jgi:CheY-like chemotaxis protein
LSVVGSLEDLSFPDILQVIHVSRQSGTLILKARDGVRRVRFRDGLVCGATLGERGPELEDLLVQRRLVDAASLRAARERRARTGEPLASNLVALGAITQERLERVVRDELRAILRALVLLQEGEFRFEIAAATRPESAAAEAEALGVREGLRPTQILQEADLVVPQRGDRGARADAGRPAVAAAAPPRRVLVVVDRAVVRYAVRDELRRRRFQVDACGTPAAALELARALAGGGTRFSLVLDLILPDPAGQGWSGGLDLLQQIQVLVPDLTAILVGEVRGPAAERAARGAGAAGYLPFPDLAGATLEEVGGRLAEFAAQVRAALQSPDRLAAGGAPSGSEAVRVVDHLSLLRGLIGEMTGREEVEIPLLVLRLAAEYFERGVLFAIRGDEALGAGAFQGEGGIDGGLDGRIRGVALPLGRGSLLQRAVQGGGTLIGAPQGGRGDGALLERLGDPVPGEAALVPIVCGGRVSHLLYGDNARSRRPVGDLRGLEIFVCQAGLALHNARLLERLEGGARTGADGRSHV